MGVFGHKRKQQEVLWRYSKTRICIAIYDHYRGRYRHSYRFYIYYNVHIYIMSRIFIWVIRDRPFNLKEGGYGFLFRSEIFFRTTQELEYYFFCRAKRKFFFPEFNIMLYDKNSESDYFFSSTKIRIFFSATLGIRIFF
jgi:hypothetical protein